MADFDPLIALWPLQLRGHSCRMFFCALWIWQCHVLQKQLHFFPDRVRFVIIWKKWGLTAGNPQTAKKTHLYSFQVGLGLRFSPKIKFWVEKTQVKISTWLPSGSSPTQLQYLPNPTWREKLILEMISKRFRCQDCGKGFWAAAFCNVLLVLVFFPWHVTMPGFVLSRMHRRCDLG